MRTTILLICVVVVMMLTGAFFLTAAPQKENQSFSRFSSLSLDISLPKDEFVPLEPIPMVLKLENRTKEKVLGHNSIKFNENHIELFVIPSDGSIRKFEISKPVSQLLEVGRMVMTPGDSYQTKDLLTVAPTDILSEPGIYQIQAVVHGGNWLDEVRSNLLFVKITEPKGADRKALALLKSDSALPNKFAGYSLSEYPQALAILEALSDDPSQSVYSDYASFRVGEFYFYSKKYDKAKRYLDKLNGKTDFIFAKNVSNHLNKLRSQLPEKSQ